MRLQWCCSLRWGSLWPISGFCVFYLGSSLPVLTDFYCFTILKEWAAPVGVVSWDGHCCMAQAETKGEAEYWRGQGQVLKCPNKVIIALSYVWLFSIWACTPQSSGMHWWPWKLLVSSVSEPTCLGLPVQGGWSSECGYTGKATAGAPLWNAHEVWLSFVD